MRSSRTEIWKAGVLLGLSFLTTSAHGAEDGDFVTSPLELIDYGVFCPHPSAGTKDAPETERGFIALLPEVVPPDFSGTVVPGTLGLSFGILYQLEPGAGEAEVVIQNIHPPIGASGNTIERFGSHVGEFTPSIALFSFDAPYEIVFGTWTLSVLLDGVEVLRKSFTVVPPDTTAISSDMCEGPPPMS